MMWQTLQTTENSQILGAPRSSSLRKTRIQLQDTTIRPRSWNTQGHAKIHWHYKCCNILLKTWDADRIHRCELHGEAPVERTDI